MCHSFGIVTHNAVSGLPEPIDDAVNNSPLDCLRAWAIRKPDATAVARLDCKRSYSELLLGIQRAATWLHGQGVRQNHTVGTRFASHFDETLHQIELAYAIGWLGATLLPLYPGTAAEQVGPVLRRFCVDWLLASDELSTWPNHDTVPQPENGMRLQTIRLSTYAFFVQTGEPIHARILSASGGIEPTGKAAGVPMCPQLPAQGFLYEFSSGTSGTPKVVLQSNANYLLTAKVSGRAQGWRSDDVYMGAMRWPHKLGLRAVFRAHCMGATLLDENFPLTRSRLGQLTVEAGLSSLTSTPVQLRMLLASPPCAAPAPALRLLSNSGAALAASEVGHIRTCITPNFYAVYGGTETGIVALLHPEDPPDAPMRVVPGVELVAVDPAGRALPTDQAGRLRIRSAWLCEGYANNALASAASFQAGWFVSNDVGAVSGGRLHLGARTDDMINFGGGKVDPLPIEEALRQHPDVADAAVVAMADVWEGQLPVAFVVARQGLNLDALRQYVGNRIDIGQLPEFFILAPSLPYNLDGKIKRDALRKVADQLRSRVKMPSDRPVPP